jgi:hypothetical protein
MDLVRGWGTALMLYGLNQWQSWRSPIHKPANGLDMQFELHHARIISKSGTLVCNPAYI